MEIQNRANKQTKTHQKHRNDNSKTTKGERVKLKVMSESEVREWRTKGN